MTPWHCQLDRNASVYLLSLPIAAISGVTYTRWGRTSCPNDTGAQLVYSGRAGGTNHLAQGGSAEGVCLPDDPDYIPESINISSSIASQFKNVIQGTNLQVDYRLPGNPLQHLHDHNVPCAVCYVPTKSIQPSWCQPKAHVRQPGLESTTAI